MKLFSHILAEWHTLKSLNALLSFHFFFFLPHLLFSWLPTFAIVCLSDGAWKLITKSLSRHRFGCRSLLKFYAFINVTDNWIYLSRNSFIHTLIASQAATTRLCIVIITIIIIIIASLVDKFLNSLCWLLFRA